MTLRRDEGAARHGCPPVSRSGPTEPLAVEADDAHCGVGPGLHAPGVRIAVEQVGQEPVHIQEASFTSGVPLAGIARFASNAWGLAIRRSARVEWSWTIQVTIDRPWPGLPPDPVDFQVKPRGKPPSANRRMRSGWIEFVRTQICQ